MSKNESKVGQPMDPAIREGAAAPTQNRERNAYALDQLIAELLALFPETTYEVSGHDGRNTALHVQFHHDDEYERLDELLSLAAGDVRVEEVLAEPSDETVLVALRSNPRVQDDRTPFGLADAYAVLAEKYEEPTP